MGKKLKKWIGKAKLRIYMLSLSLYGTLFNSAVVFAAKTTSKGTAKPADKAMTLDKANNIMLNIATGFQIVIGGLAALAVLVKIVLPLFTKDKEAGRQEAKENAKNIIVAVGIGLSVIGIVEMVKAWFL